MRSAQVVIYGDDEEGRVTGLLRDLAGGQGWALRQPRSPEACLRLLRHRAAGVVVLKAGRDLAAEMALLEQCAWLYPETPVVVVCATEFPQLAGLAWDLGARCVLPPALSREGLPEVVAALMEAAGAPPGGTGHA